MFGRPSRGKAFGSRGDALEPVAPDQQAEFLEREESFLTTFSVRWALPDTKLVVTTGRSISSTPLFSGCVQIFGVPPSASLPFEPDDIDDAANCVQWTLTSHAVDDKHRRTLASYRVSSEFHHLPPVARQTSLVG
jgi:hypothetical protein